MREILFRGKHENWMYGELYARGDRYYVDTSGCRKYEVDVNTVGQYTGKKDKNGEKIFEGDILCKSFTSGGNMITETYKVYWDETVAGFLLLSDLCDGTVDLYGLCNVIRIGNIHDTPDLWHPYEPSEGGEV